MSDTVGFLYPGHAAEDDYPRAQRLLGDRWRLAVEHTDGEDLHTVEALLDLGGGHRLAAGAARLARYEPAAVVWACTSGSFVFGTDGATRQVKELAAVAGVPATSTSFAFVDAARALGVRRVAVAASYPEPVARLFGEFLADAELRVVGLDSHGITTAAEVGRLTDEAVRELVVAHDRPDAEAILVPDTAMRTVSLVPELERHLGKPVLTANQVTIWAGLRLIGATPRAARLGRLFEADPGDAGAGGGEARWA
ncbi:maleate cis-trans isomerase family protein [Actinocatenispora sera]|uniref:Arylmalonate decarboxylase n=1 Tax=Actinocatenispora sera TaxID=390989 RepID=A0A810L9H7_9ACTN|nr:aspartate/glutamate racemase family protein [Actinocatenispora sera]BCJ30718.1 arylmalonate decarboxylase [Actinocatenispora sera]